MTTGEKLQKLRKEHKYTQEDLADILQVSRQSISKWESDSSFPETEKLVALGKLYRVTIDYLLNNENNQPEIIEKPVSRKSERVRRFLNKLPVSIVSLVLLIFGFIAFNIYQYDLGEITPGLKVTASPIAFVFFTLKTKNLFANTAFLITFILMIINILIIILHLSLPTKYFKKILFGLNIAIPVFSIIANIYLNMYAIPFFSWYVTYALFSIIQFFIKEPYIIESDIKKVDPKIVIARRIVLLRVYAFIVMGLFPLLTLYLTVKFGNKYTCPLYIEIWYSCNAFLPTLVVIPLLTKLSYKKKIIFFIVSIVSIAIAILSIISI